MAMAYAVSASIPAAYTVFAPSALRAAAVFASPHSGRFYPGAFAAASRLDALSLRRSEDCYVDEIFSDVPDLGAPLIIQNYARAYCDVNREPYELDPNMFSGPLPKGANIRSPRVAAGLGTIARVVGAGAEIYRDRLPVSEIEDRLDLVYRPYHAALESLVASVERQFHSVLVVDCHSMPSSERTGERSADIVLGDCYGQSCPASLTALIEDAFTVRGYRVALNTPYAGGFTTRHFGKPAHGRHAIQIEINRGLYLGQDGVDKTPGFDHLKTDVRSVCAGLVEALSAGGVSP